MKAQLQPWQFLLLILAGWINRRQQDVVEYLLTENRVLREKLGKNRILLNDDQGRRLDVKGKLLMRSVKEECIERMIFFGERSLLQAAVAEFLSHFHAERNHQGLGNRLIEPGEEVGRTASDVACPERLGGMLRYYYRKAA